jgi:prenyltransferase beta subunit/predicted esterase
MTPILLSTLLALLQNSDGGFAAKPGGPSSLPTTFFAVRTLRNTSGSIPDVLGCVKYVLSCRDAASGGFAQTPGGTPEIRSTALGLVVLADLRVTDKDVIPGAIAYFSKQVKGFEEIRVAVAGLEAAKAPSPDFAAWTSKIEAGRNADGTFGTGPGQARATGSAVAALLRMGVKLDKREAVLAALRAGQGPDGGWSKGEGPSDLETSYRIMRAFFMLKETPDLDKLRQFVARCHNADGGFAVLAGGASELSGAYFASTITRWIRLLEGEPAFVEASGFTPLFNGTLDGWEGDRALWSARGNTIVGKSPGLKHNDFLATEKEYDDFILRLTFRMRGDESSNSGIQFRSVRVPGHEMKGYQADIGQNYWGSLYDESRRAKTLVSASPEALATINQRGWNTYEIRAMGNQVRLTLNGVISVEYRETDPTIPRTGRIALQIHSGGPMTVEFKDIYIQPLPIPSPEQVDKPGFRTRVMRTAAGSRPYTVFVPTGYDGKTSFPVVLFLHGSGQRGDDSIAPGQVGLGGAIFAHPEAFPFIAAFPQARETWEAGSADAKFALAALDDVLANYRADRNRVILTGISMGGSGTWSIAAAEPDRFAAIVPICGIGNDENAPKFKSLPVWGFVGDDDQEAAVHDLREMVTAIRAVGGDAKETEYRAVGHNSWERAYNDPKLVEWILARAKR